MNDEYYSSVQLKDGSYREVCLSFDVDGYKPIVYGVFDAETDEDLTDLVKTESYDEVYALICLAVSERATDYFDMER